MGRPKGDIPKGRARTAGPKNMPPPPGRDAGAETGTASKDSRAKGCGFEAPSPDRQATPGP